MGGDAGGIGAGRTARRVLFTGVSVLVPYPVFRLGPFPSVPGLDGSFGAALAAGAAGGAASRLAGLRGRS